MKKNVMLLMTIVILAGGLTACKKQGAASQTDYTAAMEKSGTVLNRKTPQAGEWVPEVPDEQEPEIQEPEDQPVESAAVPNDYTIVIDPGHQLQGSSVKEPIGPGASEQKARVTSGTRGVATGVYEYELNLTVSLKLEQELKARGYDVVMVRTIHEVDLSNSERAAVANQIGADAFLRIHANGSENQSVQGALTMCMTPNNPYNSNLYGSSRRLSELVLDGLCAQTGAVRGNIIETDTMSGINWCTVPVTIVEMGYMSNPNEDIQLNTPEYQDQMVRGIADGVDQFFADSY